MKRAIRLIAGMVVAWGLAVATAQASSPERVERYDDISIYYNAMPTTRLAPDVASDYELQRSRVSGLLTIAVQRNGEPVNARIDARVLNPRNQLQTIRMREHAGGDSIYSVGTFRMEDGERMRFEVRVRPQDHDEEYLLEFSQRLFSD
ncbi:DUF4426 domain-containing protein [Aquisalimonas lutea]|uniref:DUF4426 domain-containing protein n=1 Tax=Aquisalimonas lutea TaxID=1327750 RepID=UPI0025B43BAE|nr:DUF4426 domain-containing protein [Aquisalimonas lutea]MDN3516126.1 DUF4426 domain-containing protein [Aquisalimonas lutea]